MKVISLSKAKAHLSKYGRLCHKEPVIVTVHGDPLSSSCPWMMTMTSSISSWSSIRDFATC